MPREEKASALLASSFITRESLDELLLFVIAYRARIAHTTHTCPHTLPRSPRTCTGVSCIRRHFPDDVWQRSGKKISLRSCWIPSSSSNWNFSLPPPSITLLRPLLFPSFSHSLALQHFLSPFLEVRIYLSHPIPRSRWSLGGSIVMLAKKK